jgi:hypothetical protein
MSLATPSGPGARRRAVAGAGIALAAALGTAACGQQPADSVAAQASGETTSTDDSGDRGRGVSQSQSPTVVRLGKDADNPRLSCPTGERSLMIADFAMGAKGAATPEDAVGLSSLEKGEQMVVSPRGTTAWILRADGTVREKIDLIRSDGWLLHMREACA